MCCLEMGLECAGAAGFKPSSVLEPPVPGGAAPIAFLLVLCFAAAAGLGTVLVHRDFPLFPCSLNQPMANGGFMLPSCPWSSQFQAYWTPLQGQANCVLHSAARRIDKNILAVQLQRTTWLLWTPLDIGVLSCLAQQHFAVL